MTLPDKPGIGYARVVCDVGASGRADGAPGMTLKMERAKEIGRDNCQGRWLREEYLPGVVTVIIPTYNRAYLVTEAMDSVWAQTYRPIELIVVDDGSTDDTQQVMEKWGERCADDDQFELRYFHQENRGAPAARNLGLIESRGEFIQFLDSDDLLLPEKLATALERFREDPDLDLVYSLWEYEDADGNRKRPRAFPDLENRPRAAEVAVRNLWTAAAVYCRDLLRHAGPWNERLLCSQEWEWHVRVCCGLRSAAYVPLVLAFCRTFGPARISDIRKYDPRFIRSRLEAILCVIHTLRTADDDGLDAARDSLVHRSFMNAKEAMLADEPGLAQEAILRTFTLWKRTPRAWPVAIYLLGLSLLPETMFSLSYRFFSRVKGKDQTAKKRHASGS